MRKLIGLLMLVCAGSVNAATVVMSGGQLMGATGVNVGGMFYNVEFVEGTCNGLFAGCTDFAFTTQSDASVAAQALLDQVFLGIYDISPELSVGVTFSGYTRFFTPYSSTTPTYAGSPKIKPGFYEGAMAENRAGLNGSDQVIPLWIMSKDYDTTTDVTNTYAVWSPTAVSPVPLPAATWLFGSALLGLIGYSRRKRAKTHA